MIIEDSPPPASSRGPRDVRARTRSDAAACNAFLLRVSDAFVVRYDAAAQRSLPTHQDDSHLSLTIALNDAGEYEGGGTAFEDVDGASPSRPWRSTVFWRGSSAPVLQLSSWSAPRLRPSC